MHASARTCQPLSDDKRVDTCHGTRSPRWTGDPRMPFAVPSGPGPYLPSCLRTARSYHMRMCALRARSRAARAPSPLPGIPPLTSKPASKYYTSTTHVSNTLSTNHATVTTGPSQCICALRVVRCSHQHLLHLASAPHYCERQSSAPLRNQPWQRLNAYPYAASRPPPPPAALASATSH